MVEKKKQPAGSDFWQIIFPTILGTVALALIGVWFVLSAEAGNISRFAEISTVILVVPVIFLVLVFGLLLAGVIYLVSAVMAWIPQMTERVLAVVEKIHQGIGMVSMSVARLVIEPVAWLAGFQRKRPSDDQEILLNDEKGGKRI